MQNNEAMCRVLVYFCNWLFNQKYTNYSVKYRLWFLKEFVYIIISFDGNHTSNFINYGPYDYNFKNK
jgi:hypothetical protein